MIYGPPDRRIPSKIAHYSDLIVLAPGSGLQTIPSFPQMIHAQRLYVPIDGIAMGAPA